MKFRKADREDLPIIVEMLASDKLGAKRESFSEVLSSVYYKAFERIDADKNQELIVIEDDYEQIIGSFQMSFIQYLTYKGGLRAQIEAVRIKETERGKGLGQEVFKWAINRAKEKGAHMVQLTTDNARPDAIKFYEKIGFKPSHVGMKMHLED